MTYVTDTHARMLFASGKAARMSRKCAQIFGRAGQQQERVHVSIVCFFELAMLLERGRVKSLLRFADWHDRVAQFPALPIEPLVWDDVREARGLAVLVDPFDRLIAGTPIRLDASLITGDERIRASGLVRTIW